MKVKHLVERKVNTREVSLDDLAEYEKLFQGTVKMRDDLPPELSVEELAKPEYQLLDGDFMAKWNLNKIQRVENRVDWDFHVAN